MPTQMAGFRLPCELKDVAKVATLSVFTNNFFIFFQIFDIVVAVRH